MDRQDALANRWVSVLDEMFSKDTVEFCVNSGYLNLISEQMSKSNISLSESEARFVMTKAIFWSYPDEDSNVIDNAVQEKLINELLKIVGTSVMGEMLPSLLNNMADNSREFNNDIVRLLSTTFFQCNILSSMMDKGVRFSGFEEAFKYNKKLTNKSWYEKRDESDCFNEKFEHWLSQNAPAEVLEVYTQMLTKHEKVSLEDKVKQIDNKGKLFKI